MLKVEQVEALYHDFNAQLMDVPAEMRFRGVSIKQQLEPAAGILRRASQQLRQVVECQNQEQYAMYAMIEESREAQLRAEERCRQYEAVVEKSRAGEIEARLGEERAREETEKVRSEVYAARQSAERLHRELGTIYELRDLGAAHKKKERPESAFPAVRQPLSRRSMDSPKQLQKDLGELAKGGGGGRDRLDVWGDPNETLGSTVDNPNPTPAAA